MKMAFKNLSLEQKRAHISKLLQDLNGNRSNLFPMRGQKLVASESHGVYLIKDPNGVVAHVGRTLRGKSSLTQRLNNHLSGASSFVAKSLNKDGSLLRGRYTYQFIEVTDPRERALLEHIATAWHCPIHLGLGNAP
jgi:excinuclease UvrABC nuclease subunit